MTLLSIPKKESSDRNSKYDKCRGLALISVVAAHVSGLYNEENVISNWLSCFHNNVGTIGVPIFLIIAGFFFKKQNIKSLSKKIFFIIVPWLIYGNIVYLYLYFRGQVYNYILWMLGINSYLYYLSVYLVIILLFNILPYHNNIIIIITILSAIMNFLIEFVLDIGKSYMNVGIWVMWFGIGILIKNSEIIDKIICKYGKVCICIVTGLLVLLAFLNYRFNAYFEKGYLMFEIVSAIGIMYLSNYIDDDGKSGTLLRFCGMNSFPFYFIHMPIAGIVSRILYIINCNILDLFRIPIVYLVTFLIILFLWKIMKKLNNHNLEKVVGLK